jgi:AcrR family transcriptional regulator
LERSADHVSIGSLSAAGARPSGDQREAEAPDSYDRIFLAAERLFGDLGFDGVSVREIVHAADINLAAVNYHFGSKTELYLALFRKRMRQLDSERAVLLRAAESENAGAPSVEGVLRAYIAPPILWRAPSSERAAAARFLARAIAAPTSELRGLLESDVSHVMHFRRALERALPRASQSQISWSLHFASSLAMECTDTQLKRLTAYSQGACDVRDLNAMVDRAVSFAAAGITALCSTSSTRVRPTSWQ